MSVLSYYQHQAGDFDDCNLLEKYDPRGLGTSFFQNCKAFFPEQGLCSGNYEHLTEPGHELTDIIRSQLFLEALPQLCRALISHDF